MFQLFLWTSLASGLIWLASGFWGINVFILDEGFRGVLSRRAWKMSKQILVAFLVFLVVVVWQFLRGPQV